MGFETCGPNEAMVVSGCGYESPCMIPGGRVWVWPVVQRIQRISLNTMTLQINSEHVNTKQGMTHYYDSFHMTHISNKVFPYLALVLLKLKLNHETNKCFQPVSHRYMSHHIYMTS